MNDQNGPKVSGIVALVKFGHMLENPWMLRYSLNDEDWVREPNSPESYSSDNSTAAENQQERLSVSEKKCWFLAGGNEYQKPFRSSWISRDRQKGLPNEYGGQTTKATD